MLKNVRGWSYLVIKAKEAKIVMSSDILPVAMFSITDKDD